VVVFDGDYASLAFASLAFGDRDPQPAAQVEAALIRVMAANPTVLRRLPQMAAALDLEITDIASYVLAEVGTGGFFSSFADTYGPIAVDAGLVAAEDMAAWLDEQRLASRSGVFFGSCNYHTYLLRRP
jgi:hypothetical protein